MANRPIFYKSNSAELYESCGETRRRSMGVLVTGPWPMSQPIYDSPSSVSVPLSSSISRRSVRESKDCLNCRHHQSPMRPFSVPPSLGMNGEGRDGNQMELMPLGQSSHLTVPSRATLNDLHHPSPPTCVPWLKKMKVIKKLQRKIGIGNRGGGISPNNLPPLLFNNVHGENVTISHNGAVAKRTNSFCKGIAFSDRPVKINEKICIKFVELSKSWSGVLRFGFSSHDPASMRNSLPRYACPDLTSKPGFWAKAFSDLYVKKDAILYFYVNAAGDVYFGINGEEKGLFFSGVDTRDNLWVLIDIYGNTTGIEFVDPRSQLNNSRSNVSESQQSSQCHVSNSSLQSETYTQVVVPPNDPYKLPAQAVSKVIAMYPNLALNVDHFNPLTKGKHAIVAGSVGCRREGEYSNAYIFPNQPLRAGETIVIYVQEVDYAYASSMAFGLTSCNPKEISHTGFPDDAYRLLDRPEYWVVEKDVANSPCEGDVLAFTITPEGEVVMTKNNESPKVLMHVDNSVPLFPFFDLYGTTTQIQLAGIVPSIYYRPRLQPENGRCRTELPRSTSYQTVSPYASLIRNVPHSVSAVNCSPAKFGAPSSSSQCHSAATLAAISTNDKNAATYATINKKVTGPTVSPSPAPPRDLPNWSIECVACCERPVDSVFYSCGHMCMCYQCAVEYWKTKEKGCCPICRATISDVIRTYKS